MINKPNLLFLLNAILNDYFEKDNFIYYIKKTLLYHKARLFLILY